MWRDGKKNLVVFATPIPKVSKFLFYYSDSEFEVSLLKFINNKTNYFQNKNIFTNKHYKKKRHKTNPKQTAKSLVWDWIGCLAGDCRVNIGWALECLSLCVCLCVSMCLHVPVCTPLCMCLRESQQVACVHVWPEVVDRWPRCHLHTNTTHTQDYKSGRLHPSGWLGPAVGSLLHRDTDTHGPTPKRQVHVYSFSAMFAS